MLSAGLRAWALAAVMAPIYSTAWPSHPQARTVSKTVSTSARFLPARLVADNPAQIERFRALAGIHRRDSTRHFTVRGSSLEVSHDLLAEMSGGAEAPAGAARPSGFAAFMATRHGLGLKTGGSAYGAYVPDDKWYRESPQWALRNDLNALGHLPAKPGVDIGIEKVWDKFSGSDTLVVAVLDAGYNFKHPDLAGRYWVNQAEAGPGSKPGVDDDGNGFTDDSTGWDFVDGDNRPHDYNGHGTFISGVLAAGFDDGRGIAGILAQGKVMVVRVLDASGHGDQAQIAEGIRYALANGADVINFSIGGGGSLPALNSAFQAARDKGVPIVAAAGNEGKDVDAERSFPSSYDYENLVVVGAHGPDGSASAFSNYGARVHLAAPGEAVLTCGIPDRKEIWQEDFEAEDAAAGWTLSNGISVTDVQPLQGSRSLVWSSSAAVTAAMAEALDLSGKEGAVVAFRLAYTPADASDFLILEGNKAGSSQWTEIAVIGERVAAGTVLAFALRGLDGGEVRLRFRTGIGANRSPAARVLRIDGLSITVYDGNPPTQEIYTVVDGTSIAAPHVAAYVGLQRLACDRMGISWTRARALQGVVADPLLAGKVGSGGRLDAYRGLGFYLSTLPDLAVRDSTLVAWPGGQPVEYVMEVNPSPANPYRYTATGLGPGLFLDTAAGKLTWVPERSGSYSLKLLADGPTQLRRRLSLVILEAPTASRAAAAGGGTLRIGRRTWRLPPGAQSSRRHLEVSGFDGLGRSTLLYSAWLGPADLANPPGLRSFAAAYPFFRVRLDGTGLVEGK